MIPNFSNKFVDSKKRGLDIHLANTSGNSNAYIDLDSLIFGSITVQMSNPQSGIIVAMASNDTIAEDSVTKVLYASGIKTIIKSGSNLVIQ